MASGDITVRDITNHGGNTWVGNPNFQAETINFGASDERRCLEDLYSADCDSSATKERLAQEAGLVKESFSWIFQNETFNTWLQGGSHRLLRITAGPGKGKTMTMVGIINHLEATTKSSDISYFLCQGTDDRLNKPPGIIKSLLHQILEKKSNQNLIRHLSEPYSQRGSKMFEGKNAFFVLQKILTNILANSQDKQFYFLIDGLDECEDIKDLLELIKNTTVSGSQVYWLVASRRTNDIEKFFDTYDQLIIRFEDCDAEVERGIMQYISQKITDLTWYHHDEDIKSRIFSILRDKAQGTYLWVKIAFEALKLKPYTGIDELEQIPTTIAETYDKILENLSRENDRDIILLILSTAIIAKRPLRLDELMTLVAFDPEVSVIPISERTRLVERLIRCSSFLTLQDKSVYFIHYTAKEYFKDRPLVASRHKKLYLNCLQIFQQTLRIEVDKGLASISHLEYACCYWASHLDLFTSSLDKSDTNLFARIERELLEFLGRDFLNWAMALGALRKVHEGIDQLDHFESLAIASPYEKCEGKTLRESSIPERDLLKWILEAQRFLSEHRSLLEKAPLQIHSGILFSPENSTIKSTYLSRIPPWVKTRPLISDWDRCIHVFEEFQAGKKGVELVTLSRNTKLVAVGFRSSDEFPSGTIQIWSVVSGAHMLTVYCTDALNAKRDENLERFPEDYRFYFRGLCFTEDSRKIVVLFSLLSPDAYEDIFCRLHIANRTWEVLLSFKSRRPRQSDPPANWIAELLVRASELRMLTCRTFDIAPPPSLLLSPNGNHCAGIKNEKVIIFETNSESDPSPVYLPQGHLGEVENIIFSPNSEVFATISSYFNFNNRDHLDRGVQKPNIEIRVWSVQSAALLHTLRPHLSYPQNMSLRVDTATSMSFSAENGFLAIWLAGTTDVQIWKTSTGENTGSIHLSGYIHRGWFLRKSNIFICSVRRESDMTGIQIYNICKKGTANQRQDRIPGWDLYARLSDSCILCHSNLNSEFKWLVWDLATNDTIPLAIPAEGRFSSAVAEDGSILVMALTSGLSLWNMKNYPPLGPLQASSRLWSTKKKKRSLPSIASPPSRSLSPSLRDYFPHSKIPSFSTPFISSAIDVCNSGLSFFHRLSRASNTRKRKLEINKILKGQIFQGHDISVGALNISTDNTRVATAGKEICVWDLENRVIQEMIQPCNQEITFPEVKPFKVTCILFSRDDQFLLLWDHLERTYSCNFHIYKLCKDARKPWYSTTRESYYPITAMAISPDNSTVAYATEDYACYMLLELPASHDCQDRSLKDRVTFAEKIRITSPLGSDPPLAAAYSQDGKLVAFAYRNSVSIHDMPGRTAWQMVVHMPIVPHQLSFCSRGGCLNLGTFCFSVEVLIETAAACDEVGSILIFELTPSPVPMPGQDIEDTDDRRISRDLRSEFPCLYFQDDWIWFGSHRILWIPRLYRPGKYSCTEAGVFVAGCLDGNIYSLKLDLKLLAAELGLDWKLPEIDQFCICEC